MKYLPPSCFKIGDIVKYRDSEGLFEILGYKRLRKVGAMKGDYEYDFFYDPWKCAAFTLVKPATPMKVEDFL